jgi:hypothetical protein
MYTPIFGEEPVDNIMLDLETLDTTSTAVVVSIGAVAFNPRSNKLGAKLYLEMTNDLNAQQKRGCTISGDTVVWWMRQGAQARLLFAEGDPATSSKVSTLEALELFSKFVTDNGGNRAKIWGNGADFDNIILGNLYKAFDMPMPWSFSRNRCFRTAKNIGIGPQKFTRYGVPHNALDDAITQAKHLQEITACLTSR